MSQLTPFTSPLFLLSIVVVLLIFISAIRNRQIFTMSLRNSLRRRSTALLIIVGSLVGTALITGSQIINDSFKHTSNINIESGLGEVDLQISTTYPLTFTKDLRNTIDKQLEEIVEVGDIGYIHAYSISIQKGGEAQPLQSAVTMLAGDWDQLNRFGETEGKENNLQITEPAAGNLLISSGLAQKLEVKRGDQVTIFYLGREHVYKVSDLYDPKGVSGFKPEQSLGSIIVSDDALREIVGVPTTNYNTILVSHSGGVVNDDYDPEKFTQDIQSKIDSLEEYANSIEVRERKELLQNRVEGNGTDIVFTVLSIFGIVAGALLIVNLYTMLAQERKTEMGILRAVGFQRTDLIKSFLYEGTVYAIVSALLGVVAGVGIGYLLVTNISNILGSFLTQFGIDVRVFFHVEPTTLIISFFVGTFITLISITVSSVVISRLNIVSAIRGISESRPPSIVIRILTALLAMYVLFQGIMSYALAEYTQSSLDKQGYEFAVDGYMWYLGFALILLSTSYLINRIIRTKVKAHYYALLDRITFTTASILIFAYSIYAINAEQFEESINKNPAFFFLLGFFLIIATCIVVIYNLSLILTILSTLFSRFNRVIAVLRIALRYPAERKSQTALTILMYAIILFMVIFISIERVSLNALLAQNKTEILGGFDSMVALDNPANKQNVARIIDESEEVASVSEGSSLTVFFPGIEVELPDFAQAQAGAAQQISSDYSDFLYVYDDAFIDKIDFEFAKLSDQIDSENPWEEIAKMDDAIVLTGLYAFDIPGFPKFEIDQKVTLRYDGSDQTYEKRVVGILKGSVGAGLPYGNILISERSFAPAQSDRADSIYLLTFTDPESSGKELKGELARVNEYNIFVAQETLNLIQAFLQQFIYLAQGFLAFGLLVGLAGLGVTMMKSVTERNQQIGMLRSLGFTRGMIISAVLIEASLIGLLGIGTGVFAGSVGGVNLLNATTKAIDGFETVYPYSEVIILCTAVYLGTLLFAIIPAWKASRLQPIEATNYQE